MLAILYEIEKSGFADMLRSGLVITGGCAKTANLGSFIYDLSGYKVRIGYPKKVFTYQGCDGITETSAATSIGLILSAVNDQAVNCTVCDPAVRNVDVVVEVEQDDRPEGQLFREDEIEKVEPKPKPKPEQKENCIKIKIKKITKAVGGLYDIFMNEDIANEKA